MKKLKVLTLAGTRPEIIRLSEIIRRLDQAPSIEHILVHTGQNYDYELNQIFFEDLELRPPDYFLHAAGSNASLTVGNILISLDPVLEKEAPDAFLVLGDTNSALGAIAAKKRHIPVFHMEAGNRSFDQRIPEETNRKIVDHLSDINMTYSTISRHYLISEGISPDRIVRTGSPMFEVLNRNIAKAEKSTILTRLKVEKNEFFVVSAHREENIAPERNFNRLTAILNTVAETYAVPIIVTAHPRTRKRIVESGTTLRPLVRLIRPLGLSDFLYLQMNAIAVISDSGTLSEESSILGFPAVNIRESHERPEAMEETTVIMAGLNPERILQALAEITPRRDQTNILPVADYFVPNVSEKVLRIILSYTDYVRRTVWAEETSSL